MAGELIQNMDKRMESIIGYEKERLNAIDNASRVLMTMAGVFALLLGLGSWKTLDDQRRSANENLNLQISQFNQQFDQAMVEHARKAEETLDDVRSLRAEIHQDFPMFGRMRRNFTKILDELQSACQRLDPADDESYSKLTWEERERILFYERAVADSLLLDTRDYGEELSEIYRLLGIFYGSRHTSSLVQKTAPQRGDLDRARFYFDHAILIDPKNYLALSNAGHFLMFNDDVNLATAARDYLRRAALAGGSRQKPWVNLALLEIGAFKNPDASLVAVEEALKGTEWDKPRSQPKNHHCAYVRACALAEKAKTATDLKEQRALWEAAVGSLEDAAKSADLWMHDAFLNGDYQNDPDRVGCFGPLCSDVDFGERFEHAVELIQRGTLVG